MGGRPYYLVLALAVVAVTNLDCGAPGSSSHLPRRDVTDSASRTACQHKLSRDIDTCLLRYERLLVSSRALDTKPGQLERSVARRLCRLVNTKLHVTLASYRTSFLSDRLFYIRRATFDNL